MSLRRYTTALVAVASIATAVGVATSPLLAAPSHTVRYVTDASDVVEITPNGRWAIVRLTSGATVRLDLDSGATTNVPVGSQGAYQPGALSDDGTTYWWIDGQILRRTAVGGSTTTFANPFTSPIEGELWIFTGVDDVEGDTPILSASNGVFGNARFRFDPVSRQATRLIPAFAPPPAEHDSSLGQSIQSANGEWATFWSRSPDVLDGLTTEAPRLFRRHLPSGATHLVRALDGTSIPVWLTDTGLVLFSFDAPDRQLFAWSRPGKTPEQLTVTPSGGPPNGSMVPLSPVNTVHATADGTRVVFNSFAGNLDGSRSPGVARLYVATLPLAYPNGEAVVGTTERVCVNVVGAAPGEFVAVNVTPVLAIASGFGTMHSSDDDPGATSSVNVAPGSIDPNVTFVKVGADGEICYSNSVHGPVHLVIDELVVGTAGVFSVPTASGAARLIDTRDSEQVAPSGTVCVTANGAPGDFTAINVTPVDASAGGFGVLHSSDDVAGATSNVNFGPGTIDPNTAFTQIGTDGKVCFTNSVHGPVNVVLDQLLVAPASVFSLPTTAGAARLVDTREIGPPLPRSARRCVAAVGAEPGDWVVVNITPVEASAPGFATLHSSDDEAGATSSVNFAPGTIDPNLGIVEVGTDGQVCFTNSRLGSVHVVLDQLVTVSSDSLSQPTADGATRLIDTRIGRS